MGNDSQLKVAVLALVIFFSNSALNTSALYNVISFWWFSKITIGYFCLQHGGAKIPGFFRHRSI
jgi:hypothetical protein